MDTSLALFLILGLPILGFLLQAVCGGAVVKSLGERRGRTLMGWVAFAPIFIGFLIALSIVFQLMGMDPKNRLVIATLFNWIDLQSLSVPFALRADTLSMTMTLVVTGIGSLIHMYAIKYMFDDKDFTRFFTYLNLFIAFMLLLVLGNNLVMLFIGWEGVGLCSYLLIGYWYKDLSNAKSANKAFITNRVGDWGLTLGIFLLAVLVAMGAKNVHSARWLSYDVLLPNMSMIVEAHPLLATLAGVFLFIGAMGKSAQFPLYVWLPDAMAGPTPVSALIHAATMVTAGVFLLNRMSPLYSLVPVAQVIVVVAGALTALLGALIAFGQTDIKKVLAFSTVSQLGYMFIACGVGAYWAGIFHVVTHAFFKALLFLGAGAVIYAMSHNQDMRNYGNLKKYIPVTFWTMFAAWAAIAGVPFLFAGAYSKEAILGAAVNVSDANELLARVGPIAGWVGFGVALLTAGYMTRLMMLTFAAGEERWRTITPQAHQEEHHEVHAHGHAHHDDPHGFFYTDEDAPKEEHEHHHGLTADHEPAKVPWEMLLPLVVLAAGATFVTGYFMEHNEAFAHWLYPGLGEPEHAHYGKLMLLIVGTAMAVAGIAYGYVIYHGKKLTEREGWDMSQWSPFRRSAYNQFEIDETIAGGSVAVGGFVGRVLAWFDKWIVDGIVNLVGSTVQYLAGFGKYIQRGFVRSYALLMVLGVAGILYAIVRMWIQVKGD